MKNPSAVAKLFGIFFKIGAFTFGGGYAMIPLIQSEVVDKNKWITEEDILDIIAIAESTPGPIAINSATFVGYKVAGFWGAVAATFGVVLPSFIIISVLSYILDLFNSVKAVKYAFFGIRAGVLALLIKALWSMYSKCPKGLAAYLLMAASFIAVALFDIGVLWVILGCAAVGIMITLFTQRGARA
ncbi:MAG: chromate transporter [Clostridia bacterium]|nr:chromate transporter [Clostridia bacterium]